MPRLGFCSPVSQQDGGSQWFVYYSSIDSSTLISHHQESASKIQQPNYTNHRLSRFSSRHRGHRGQALFRRGKALLALGHGDRAEKDLKQVLEAMVSFLCFF
jgi:hypothetical protein